MLRVCNRGLRYTGHEESLSEMYASLLATAMNEDTIQKAHPAFVDIIKQLTPDEAKIVRGFTASHTINPLISIKASSPNKTISDGHQIVLRNFSQIGQRAGCEHIHLVPAYLDNLVRMGLCEIPEGMAYSSDTWYSPLINHPEILSKIEEMRHFNRQIEIKSLYNDH